MTRSDLKRSIGTRGHDFRSISADYILFGSETIP